MRPPSHLPLLALLASMALAQAEPAPASAAASPEPPPASPHRLLVRTAFLVGGRTGTTLPPTPTTHPSSPEPGVEALLMSWDPDRDNPELARLLALERIANYGRQATTMPAAGGSSTVAFEAGEDRYAFDLELSRAEDGRVTFEIEGKRNGTVIAAPRIVARLGERAAVSTSSPTSGPYVFMIVQADELPEAAAQAPEAATP